MKNAKNKTKASLITLFLILTIATPLFPIINAHTPPWTITSWTQIAVTPNPVGVGQHVNVIFWADSFPRTAAGSMGDRFTFNVEITKPDGTTETRGPITSDPVGGGTVGYVPDQVGNYTIIAELEEHKYTGLPIPTGQNINTIAGAAYVNDTYLGSKSKPFTLTVQAEPLQAWPGTPLPTEYWTRPIDAGNKEWSQISGNWLADGRGNNYTNGPETAHIVWTKPLAMGGIIGQPLGDISYYTGSSYEGAWVQLSEGGSRNARPAVNYWFESPVIMNGYMYINMPQSDSITPTHDKFVCVDLRTGEEKWYINGTRLNFGIIYDYESPNQSGGFGYLWAMEGTTAVIYNPISGDELFRITNVPSYTPFNFIKGPMGEPLIYTYDNTNGWLACWNFSAIPALLAGTTGLSTNWQWRPVGKIVDGRTGYQWNVTVPKGLGIIQYAMPDRVFGYKGLDDVYNTVNFTMWMISTKPGQQGQVLWKKDLEWASGGPWSADRVGPWSLEDNVITINNKQTRTWYAYSLDTGEQLWKAQPMESDWDIYYSGSIGKIAYSKLYSASYGGRIHCYDIKTGELLWTQTTDTAGLEGVYERWPTGTGSGSTIADGKIYQTTSEHSVEHPINRGWKMYCINASTGEHIWNISSLGPGPAIADGYLVGLNYLNYQVHVYGKGPTDIEVAASPKVSELGKKVLVEGSVVDISAGTKSSALAPRFPDGVPAIADEYMTPWMEYVYHQHEKPTNAMGVEVVVSVMDPNNNLYEVGRTRSDATGTYKLAFDPQVPGEYTVISTFPGSKSYWPSVAETAIVVEDASPTPTQQPVATLPPTEMYVLGIGVAIIIAIAIVGAILFMAIKRRP